jgi:hypothetical protein
MMMVPDLRTPHAAKKLFGPIGASAGRSRLALRGTPYPAPFRGTLLDVLHIGHDDPSKEENCDCTAPEQCFRTLL